LLPSTKRRPSPFSSASFYIGLGVLSVFTICVAFIAKLCSLEVASIHVTQILSAGFSVEMVNLLNANRTILLATCDAFHYYHLKIINLRWFIGSMNEGL
jgi:hypothetical protein